MHIYVDNDEATEAVPAYKIEAHAITLTIRPKLTKSAQARRGRLWDPAALCRALRTLQVLEWPLSPEAQTNH